MKRAKLVLGLLIILFSINFVFASWCNDTDAKEKEGVYPRGMNYYQNGVNSGANNFGNWNQEDFCKGNKIYEFYCYYSRGNYYNGTAVHKCLNGCNAEFRACNSGTLITGLATMSSAGNYLGIGVVIIIVAVVIWFFLRKKK